MVPKFASVASIKASTLFDELVLPGRSQKLATRRQSATSRENRTPGSGGGDGESRFLPLSNKKIKEIKALTRGRLKVWTPDRPCGLWW